MKMISIVGSSHGKKGNTATLVESVMNAASSESALTETFLLSDYTINSCKGGMTCCKTGRCAIDDDFGQIKNAMLEADGIVLACIIM